MSTGKRGPLKKAGAVAKSSYKCLVPECAKEIRGDELKIHYVSKVDFDLLSTLTNVPKELALTRINCCKDESTKLHTKFFFNSSRFQTKDIPSYIYHKRPPTSFQTPFARCEQAKQQKIDSVDTDLFDHERDSSHDSENQIHNSEGPSSDQDAIPPDIPLETVCDDSSSTCFDETETGNSVRESLRLDSDTQISEPQFIEPLTKELTESLTDKETLCETAAITETEYQGSFENQNLNEERISSQNYVNLTSALKDQISSVLGDFLSGKYLRNRSRRIYKHFIL